MNQIKQKFQILTAHVLISFSIFFVSVASAGVVFPSNAFAAVTQPSSSYCSGSTTFISGSATTDTAIKFITCLLEQSVVPFLFAMATAVFVWGMVKFINTQESAEREKGKQFMLWGVIALAVMFCVWGLVNVLGNTFSVKSVIPQLGQ